MKMLVAMAVLTAVIASPALAKTMNRQAAGPLADRSFAQSWQGPGQSFALQGQSNRRVHSTRPSVDVYGTSGEYIGSDPDPLIRGQLRDDPPGRDD